jgi:hypothetical protein
MVQSILDFTFERTMLPFEFRQMVLQRHVGPSYSIFRLGECDIETVASRRQNMLQYMLQRGIEQAWTSLPSASAKSIISPLARPPEGGHGNLDFSMIDRLELESELARLKQEHRDLDTAIEALEGIIAGDQLQVQRLKKRKLVLKDQIIRLEDQLTPDIIA